MKQQTVTNEVENHLRSVFGHETFRPGQQQVVERILAGDSALAVFPTGGGKSLCYQLPALMLEGMTLVVSPLIALMKDQIDFLVGKGVKAARMDSSLSADESRQVWDDLWQGRLKLLYVAPERFASERFLQRLRRVKLSLMVIDEAHCISEWGHNFRPDYMKLADMSRELQVERVLCLTATATPAVASDIRKAFAISDEAYVNTGFHRPNLTMYVTPCRENERDALLLERLKSRSRGATIVYVTLQKTAMEVAAFLKAAGIPAKAYHAGLASELRHEIQDGFMSDPEGVVVATIAFGMGIDKADIRYVYHLNPPKSLENYMQETGRAGRDGKPSTCELLFCGEDVATLENFSYGDTPSLPSVEGLVRELMAEGDRFDVSMYTLSSVHDIRLLVISTMLTYLELDGILVSTGPLYNEYKFQPMHSTAEIFKKFDVQRAAFLKNIFNQARKGSIWYTLDIGQAVMNLGESRERIVAALNYLEEQGDLTLKVAGLRHGYRFLKRPEDPLALAKTLHDRFRESEARDIARIREVMALAATPSCIVRKVLSYFGEELTGDCGHCDRCLGIAQPRELRRQENGLTEAEMRLIQEWASRKQPALREPRQLARFFCGITSPATTKAKLTRDPDFGRLAHRGFAAVARAAAACL
ncbi:MAG: RecQ family ATP-dependent DNA helicase [Verrucomicrobia bacterium]|nr:RecQ family ATP-dependent DNA helicase [Verrucomicrobiota bacterium]